MFSFSLTEQVMYPFNVPFIYFCTRLENVVHYKKVLNMKILKERKKNLETVLDEESFE